MPSKVTRAKPTKHDVRNTYYYHYAQIRESLDKLMSDIYQLYQFATPDLFGRAEYQIRRVQAGLPRHEGRGDADPSKVQCLSNYDPDHDRTIHWRLTPAERVVHELALMTGHSDRYDASEVEVIVRIDQIPAWCPEPKRAGSTKTKTKSKASKSVTKPPASDPELFS